MVAARTAGPATLDLYGQIAAIAFVAALAVWLWRTRPALPPRPAGPPLPLSGLGFGRALATITGGLIALFVISFAAHPWLVVVAALTPLSAWQIAVHRKDITHRAVGVALALGGICLALSHLAGRLDGFQAFYLICIPPLFLGGALLARSTGLARVDSVDGSWGRAAAGLVAGSVLAVPAALLNVSHGAHSGDVWIDQIWEPAVALVPGIAEETWARLFMLTLVLRCCAGLPGTVLLARWWPPF